MGRISLPDQTVIFSFYKERNSLFHGNVFTSLHPIALPEAEKTRLMELAGNASQILTNRVFSVWTDEGTGDTSNKSIPQPEKPESVRRIMELKKQISATWRKD